MTVYIHGYERISLPNGEFTKKFDCSKCTYLEDKGFREKIEEIEKNGFRIDTLWDDNDFTIETKKPLTEEEYCRLIKKWKITNL